MISLFDKFVDPNGTALSAHSPNIGGPWTSDGPGLVIQNNKLTGSDASGVSRVPLIGSTQRVSLAIDWNGADDASLVGLALGDSVALNDYVIVSLYGTGKWDIDQANAAGDDLESKVLPATTLPRATKVELILASSYLQLRLNGQVVSLNNRIILPSTAMELFKLTMNVAAGAYPLISNLLIQR